VKSSSEALEQAQEATRSPGQTRLPSVADAMVTTPKTHGLGLTVQEALRAFDDDHVHMLLLTCNEGQLHGTLIRDDLGDHLPAAPAMDASTLAFRTVRPTQLLSQVTSTLLIRRTRRLAVTDADGLLVGLLCLKRTLQGFCTDVDVRHRAADHARDGDPCTLGAPR
jgi:CBS domain-containing protein